jgi:hypothetical protein
MISLSRAFFYAGVKSLITTLWNVEDTRTMHLSHRFYRHLNNGRTKDAALGLAQREYLQTLGPGEKPYAHPVYWSALIPVGNMDALQLDRAWDADLMRWILIIATIATIIAWFVMRRKKQRSTV